MSVVNAYLLYTKLGGTKRQIWFRKQLIRSLVAADDRPTELQPTTSAFMHHKASDLSRLSGQHYFDVIPATDAKSTPTRKCVVCRKRGRRKETHYLCETGLSRPAPCVVQCASVGAIVTIANEIECYRRPPCNRIECCCNRTMPLPYLTKWKGCYITTSQHQNKQYVINILEQKLLTVQWRKSMTVLKMSTAGLGACW